MRFLKPTSTTDLFLSFLGIIHFGLTLFGHLEASSIHLYVAFQVKLGWRADDSMNLVFK